MKTNPSPTRCHEISNLEDKLIFYQSIFWVRVSFNAQLNFYPFGDLTKCQLLNVRRFCFNHRAADLKNHLVKLSRSTSNGIGTMWHEKMTGGNSALSVKSLLNWLSAIVKTTRLSVNLCWPCDFKFAPYWSLSCVKHLSCVDSTRKWPQMGLRAP